MWAGRVDKFFNVSDVLPPVWRVQREVVERVLSAHCFDEFREVARGDAVSSCEFAAYEGVRYPRVRLSQRVPVRSMCVDFVSPPPGGFNEVTGAGVFDGWAQAGCDVWF